MEIFQNFRISFNLSMMYNILTILICKYIFAKNIMLTFNLKKKSKRKTSLLINKYKIGKHFYFMYIVKQNMVLSSKEKVIFYILLLFVYPASCIHHSILPFDILMMIMVFFLVTFQYQYFIHLCLAIICLFTLLFCRI